MVYFLHLPALWLVARFVTPVLPQNMPGFGMAVALAAALGLSTPVHRVVGRPAYRWCESLS